MARFFVNESDITGQLVKISGPDAHHISRVLRLKPDDYIEVVLGSGKIGKVKLIAFADDLVEGQIVQSYQADQESPINLRLYQGLAKGDKMDLVVQKAVELGVTEIIPFSSRFTVVKLDGAAAEKRRQRWQRIAEEAAKQCRRTQIPNVSPVMGFQEVLDQLSVRDEEHLVLLPYENEERQGIKDLEVGSCSTVSVIIGPEGGFHVQEVEGAQQIGAKIITLGPRILRTETAGLVALSLVGYRWGDLG